ncbi:RidA family protein [Amycolatopsis sp. CA-230715]|uniref:RidA family protein n=1 Tax=Amycolatopsis sp. CA-230715 TaxID=2745196 RepID=UPI001C0171B4|nr:RidA family protein [Amycolatopsis sp. CA-230715]QWF80759.1 2-iminobutanoate/2-iminopropanoate deaminase [Amycolatopsis sp. CA-230715]
MTSPQRVTHDPDWYEPYRISLAIKANGLIFVSGQAGIDERGRTVAPDFETQAHRAFQNVRTVLGGSLADVVKVTIMVTDMSHLDRIVELRSEYFAPPYPADTLVQVAGLAQPDWLIEIDAIAVDPHFGGASV